MKPNKKPAKRFNCPLLFKALSKRVLNPGWEIKLKRKGYIFLLPFIIGFVFYFSLIVIQSIRYGFSKNELGARGFESTFNGWANYVYAFTEDPHYILLLRNSINSFAYSIPVILIFSLFVAVLLNQGMRGRVFFRAVFFVPVIVATGLITKVDMQNTVLNSLSSSAAIVTGGLADGAARVFSYESIQGAVMSLGFGRQFTGYVLNAVDSIIQTINSSGVQILIFLSGLQSIPPSIYEAAQIEGASGWESFWKITFPMISPLILVNLFYSVIDYFTQTGNAMMNYTQELAFGKNLYGEAIAMSWAYFAFIAAILAVIGLIAGRFVFYMQRGE